MNSAKSFDAFSRSMMDTGGPPPPVSSGGQGRSGWKDPAVLVPAAVALGTAIWSARNAKNQRNWEEKMANTSHQREVADLTAAGLNPMLSVNRGAVTPEGAQGEVPDGFAAIASALALKKMKADIDLTESQAQYTRVQSHDLETQANSGRYRKISAEADLAEMTAQEKLATLPTAIDRARAELERTRASTKQMKALERLSHYQGLSEKQIAEFAEDIGESGPAVKYVIELLRSINLARK